MFLVFLIYSRASVPGLLSSYDSWINLSSEETLQWFVFSIIHNIRLAPHCAGPFVVTAPPGLQKNNHSRRRGWVPKCFQCGASPVTHTVMSSFCLCSEPIYYVEQKIKKYIQPSQPDMSVDIPTQVNALSLYLLNLHCCTVLVFFT